MAKKSASKTIKSPGKLQKIRSLPRSAKQRLNNRLTRRLPHDPHHNFKLTSRRHRQLFARDMRSAWGLLRETVSFVKLHYKVLVGIGMVYALVSYMVVGGISQIDYAQLKTEITNVLGGKLDSLPIAAALFGFGFFGILDKPATEIQQFLGGLITALFWLATVWAARMLMAKKSINIRDALYNSGTPLIPLTLLILVATLQLLPLGAAIAAYGYGFSNGWIQGGVEAFVLGGAVFLVGTLTLYWLVSTFMAGMVITLPGMYPLRALRESSDLVIGRRWSVALRMLFAVLVLFIAWAVIMIPIFILDAWLDIAYLPLVPLFLQVMSGFTLPLISVYLYKLYRSLL